MVAAAIKARADAIISADRHFQTSDLAIHGVEVWRPNALLMRLYRADKDLLLASLANARRNLSRTRPAPDTFIADIRRCGGMDEFCDTIETHMGDL